MKTKILGLLFCSMVLFSSCTAFWLDQLEGGHSPMMQLDGKWNIDKHQEITADETHEITTSERVWFNAQKDIGDYCEGTWLQTKQTDPEFLWGIDPNGEEFVMQDDNGNDVTYNVLKQKKNIFIIERTANGVTTHMEFSR